MIYNDGIKVRRFFCEEFLFLLKKITTNNFLCPFNDLTINCVEILANCLNFMSFGTYGYCHPCPDSILRLHSFVVSNTRGFSVQYFKYNK